MTLLYIDGFEGYAIGDDRFDLDVDYDFDELIGQTEAGIIAGRTTGKALFIDDGNNAITPLLVPVAGLSSQDDWIVAFAIYTDHPEFDLLTGDQQVWLQFLDSEGAGMLSIYPAAGVLNVRSGSTSGTKLGFTNTRLTTKVWHFFECKVNFHATTGSVAIRIDEEQVLALTNVNTVGSTTDNRPSMLRVASSGNGLQTRVDDFYILDDQGSQHNNFLGDLAVTRLNPTGAGNSTQFSVTGVASNWDAVNEDGPDGDTTYVQSNTSGQKDTYTFSDISGTPAAIEAVAVKSYCKKTDGGSRTFVHVARSSGVEGESATIYPSAISYRRLQSVFPQDPNTSAAWAAAGVNAAEFGFRINA